MESKQPQEEEDASVVHPSELKEPQEMQHYLREHFQQVAKNDFFRQYMIMDLAMTEEKNEKLELENAQLVERMNQQRTKADAEHKKAKDEQDRLLQRLKQMQGMESQLREQQEKRKE